MYINCVHRTINASCKKSHCRWDRHGTAKARTSPQNVTFLCIEQANLQTLNFSIQSKITRKKNPGRFTFERTQPKWSTSLNQVEHIWTQNDASGKSNPMIVRDRQELNKRLYTDICRK